MLSAGQSEDRIPVGARFSTSVQTGPGAQPMGTRAFLRVKQPGHGVDYPPPSSAKIKERVELYLYSLCVVPFIVASCFFTFSNECLFSLLEGGDLLAVVFSVGSMSLLTHKPSINELYELSTFRNSQHWTEVGFIQRKLLSAL